MVMATFSISAVARKAQATANGSTTQFAFSFSVNTEADVAVFVGTTLKTISTHYTVSITSSTGAGSITFTSGNTPSNGQIVTIMSKTALARSSVYTSGGTINATSLETDFDTNMMLFQQQDERLDRVISAPVDDATSIDMTLPNKDARKGTVLGFNATSGNPEAGPSITAVQSLANVTTAINLLGTSDAVSDMNTLATSSNVTNQNTLAGISGNITTVAGIASNVTAVAGDATDIGAVAGKATEIGLLGNSTTIGNMGQLGTSAVVEDLGLLATSAVIEDMGLLATSAVIEDMGLLATSAVIEDMGLLATSAVIEDMGQLANSTVLSNIATLASDNSPSVSAITVGGASQFNGTLTVGANDQGYDVTLHGDTAARNVKWDSSADSLLFTDNAKILMGAGSDLQLYHTGSTSVISEQGTGDLNIQTNGANIALLGNGGSEYMANFASDGAAKLFFNNGEKIATTNTGINVTGNVVVSGTVDGVDLQTLNSAVTANTSKTTNATHSGEVTGSGALTIADNIVDEANLKVSNSPVNGYMLTAQSGNTGGLTWAAAGGGGGMEFLASTGAISDGTASVIFNQFDASKYDYYIFNVIAVVPTSDSVQLLMQLSADGTNYDTTNGNYHEGSSNRTGLRISANNAGGASGEIMGISVAAKLFNVSSSSTNTYITSHGGYQNASGTFAAMSGVGNYQASTAAHTAVKILFNSGNIESGEITMFGVVNS